jgi:hypothetical protein
MRNLNSSRWIKFKGLLFLLLGLLSAALMLLDHLTPKTVLLLLVTVWSFRRFYYFAFYVIEHYVDPDYRFSGLPLLPALFHSNKESGLGKNIIQPSTAFRMRG